VEESEGLRRDGAWEHGVFQERAAGEAPLHDLRHVCVLIHLAVVQASICVNTLTDSFVTTAPQVRVGYRES
jgi:hypothetical protein